MSTSIGDTQEDMLVNWPQQVLGDAAYLFSQPFRWAVGGIEMVTRPDFSEKGYVEQGAEITLIAASAIATFAFFIPTATCYCLSALVGRGRFELLQPSSSPQMQATSEKVIVISLNLCLQVYAPFTGGVVHPFDYVGPQNRTRIQAIADKIGEIVQSNKGSPIIFAFQECEDRAAQTAFMKEMERIGLPNVVVDRGKHPVKNTSGLGFASNRLFKSIQFNPYLLEDRHGLLYKGSDQGAFSIGIENGKELFSVVNIHGNFGDGDENEAARERQLKNYVIPLFKSLPGNNKVIVGDSNSEKVSESKLSQLGLQSYTNPLYGKPTCTDRGKHDLRGKKPCEGSCEESIDVMIHDPKQLKLDSIDSKLLEVDDGKGGKTLLSDHKMIVATFSVGK